MDRFTHRTENPYEVKYGYARAVRRGPLVFVSGTTSIDPATGVVQHAESAHLQAQLIFGEIIRAVEAVGGRKEDIARVRMFVTAEADADDVGQALRQSLGDVAPAATMIVGARFVSPEMRVEIEADAVVRTRRLPFVLNQYSVLTRVDRYSRSTRTSTVPLLWPVPSLVHYARCRFAPSY